MTTVFEYSAEAHQRKHGPRGYQDYRSYKPWLRDEFAFRCVYCLWRENWCADGDGSFSVEHLLPRVTHPDRVCDYDNVVYSCSRCNSLKQDAFPVLDPCEDGWGAHLQAVVDGTVRGITQQGKRTIEDCRLNRPKLVEARRRMFQLLDTLRASERAEAKRLLAFYLGFPGNLPVLTQLNPPSGNTRPQGIASSFYEQKQRGELPGSY